MSAIKAPSKRRWVRLLVASSVPVVLALSACSPSQTAAPTSAAAKPTQAAASPAPTTAPASSGSPSAAASPASAMSPMPAMSASPSAAAGSASPVARPAASPMASPSPAAMAQATDIKGAADLRTVLDDLLQEHVYLAASATGAALGGRDDEFKAAAETLDANSVQLSKVIGAAYGGQAEQSFLALWRKHIGFFVDYTQGAAGKDQAKQDKARQDLDSYRADADAFFSGANDNLPKGAVADLLIPHTRTLLAVIDAQADEKPDDAFANLKMAADHMHMIGDPLAAATAKKFPDKFPGSSDASAAGLQATLNQLLQEHVYLAGAATNAAGNGRDDEFKVAAATLDKNSVELSQAIGSAYGPQAEQAFLPLWRKHIGFFVDYTQGAAAKDDAKKAQAAANLDGYRADADAFFSGANDNLPKGAVADLLKPHVTQLAGAVDSQVSHDYPKAYKTLKEAADHMRAIGDPLAAATAKKFPDKFQN